MNKNEVTPVQIAIRIVIIIIVIVILLLVSFAMVRFVPKVISSLSNIGTVFGVKERIILSLDKKDVSEGDEAILSFRQKGGKNEGYYTIGYSCSKIDSHTKLEVRHGNNGEVIDCNQTLRLETSTTTPVFGKVTLQALSDRLSYDQPLSITVKHINATSSFATADITLNLLKNTEKKKIDGAHQSEPVASSTPVVVATSSPSNKPTPRNTPPKPTYYPTTPADLSITLGQITVDRNGRANVTFNVTNVGSKSTGAWRFHATLPREVGQTVYDSPFQASIPAHGTSIMYFAFDNAKAGTISIFVDYFNQIRESNEGNNSASAILR